MKQETNNKKESITAEKSETSSHSLIKLKSNTANGKARLSNAEGRKINIDRLEIAMKRTGKFELYWYPACFIAGLISFILAGIYGGYTWELWASLLCLYACMIGNNLVARGYRYGMIITSVEMAVYVVICFITQVWGEVIINVFMYIPLELIGLITWKKKTSGEGVTNERLSDVKSLKPKQWLIVSVIMIVGTLIVWLILKLGFKQQFAIFNAISIVCFTLGAELRNRRFKEIWYLFMIGNVSGMVLWILVSTNINLGTLPNVVSFIATLTNNFNGLYIWNRLYKHSQKTKSVYLAMRDVNIKRVAKLKRTYKTMKCKEL